MKSPGKASLDSIRSSGVLDMAHVKITKNQLTKIPEYLRAYAFDMLRAQKLLGEQIDRYEVWGGKQMQRSSIRTMHTCRPYGYYLDNRRFTCRRVSVCPMCHGRQVDEVFDRMRIHAHPNYHLAVTSYTKRPTRTCITQADIDTINTVTSNIRRSLDGPAFIYRRPEIFNRGVGMRVSIVHITENKASLCDLHAKGANAKWRIEPALESNIFEFTARVMPYCAEVINTAAPIKLFSDFVSVSKKIKSNYKRG